MTFRKYIENDEEEQLTKEINENAGAVIGSALGYGTIGLAAAFGGSLLIYAGVKATGALVKLWKNIIKSAKQIGKKPSQVVRAARIDPMAKREKEKIDRVEDRYRDELRDVISAIHEQDFDTAKQEFMALSSGLKNLPDINKIVIKEITKTLEIPPLYVTSPGNKNYQAIKKILGIRIARAAAEAIKMSIEKEIKE